MRIDASTRALVTGPSRRIGLQVEAARTPRAIAIPGFVRLLGSNGIAPRLTGAVVRRLRGGTAEPRGD